MKLGVGAVIHVGLRSEMGRRYAFALRAFSEVKSFPEFVAYVGGTDLRFRSPQPDTSSHCKTRDAGLAGL